MLDATPPELVSVAAASGFRTVRIRLSATPSVGVPPYDMLSDTPVLRETLSRLADTGVSVLDVEFLRFEPGALPLRDLVAALPATIPLAIEAPARASAQLPALERARRAYRALSMLLEEKP